MIIFFIFSPIAPFQIIILILLTWYFLRTHTQVLHVHQTCPSNFLCSLCIAYMSMFPGLTTCGYTTYMGAHPWRKQILPDSTGIGYPPTALHLGVELCGISLDYAVMSTSIVTVLILFRQPCCWGFMGAFTLWCLEEYFLIANILSVWFQSFYCFFFLP